MCQGCNTEYVSNGLYMTEADIGYFHKAFCDGYNLAHPDKLITDQGVKTITFVLTEECNLRCTYCYMHGKNPKKMTKEIGKQAVDFILDDGLLNGYIDPEAPGVILDFIGGEPLLNIEVLDYIVEYFKYRTLQLNHRWATNYNIGMSTNGTLYKTKAVQDFNRRNLGRFVPGMTIDGNKALHDACRIYPNGKGSYDDVVENLQLLLRNGGPRTTKVTLAPQNLKYMREATLHLFSLGLDTVSCNVQFEDVWNDELAAEFYVELKKLADDIIDNDLYKTKYTSLFSEMIGEPMDPADDQNWCGGSGAMLAIDPDGLVYPCLRYMSYCFSNKDREPFVIGNIWTGVVDKNTYKPLQDLKAITRSSQSTKECFYCPIAKGCSWCSAYNYDVFGTANKRATFHCCMQKARVLANVYFWNKLYRKLGLSKRFKLHVPEEWALVYISKEEYEFLKELSKED
jgi:uncharacterized protein